MGTIRNLWVWAILLSFQVNSKELIREFHSDITLHPSGLIEVTETIEVKAEGIQIRRGIFRDFPTQYMGAWLTQKEVGFEVQSVLRNGEAEAHHLKPLKNGFRVYVGSASTVIPPGVHRYQLTYTTDRQLGYFDHHDEFYWNVTGNGWDFDILKASVTIHVPDGAVDQVFDQQAWTGYQGEQLQYFETVNTERALGFKITRPLAANQGLTIGLSFPKGIFAPPPFDLARFLSNNLVWILTVLMALAYASFCFVAWLRYGKDPEPGVIVAHYRSPKNLSPALAHFIENEAVNDKTLTAAILSLAVKGYVHIKQYKNSYLLTKKTANTPLTEGEQIVFDQLFLYDNKLKVDKSYCSRLSSAKSRLTSWLNKEYRNSCFKDNRFYVIWAWVISAAVFLSGTLLLYQPTLSFGDMMVVGFGLVTVSVFAAGFFMATPILFAVVVLGVLALTFADLLQWMLDHKTWLMFTGALVFMNLIFAWLMRSPTLYGRHLKNEVDGLKMYMRAAEEHRLDMLNPPAMDKTHFEALFPYALALGLENRWAAHFAALFNTDEVESKSSYQPEWFDSHYHGSFSSTTFSAATRAMGRSMAVAAVKPVSKSSSVSSYSSSSSSYSSSSSSYSSSGGSSGGGGGGGGGGGW